MKHLHIEVGGMRRQVAITPGTTTIYLLRHSEPDMIVEVTIKRPGKRREQRGAIPMRVFIDEAVAPGQGATNGN